MVNHWADQADDPGNLTRGNIRYFPVVPSRLEFAEEVRNAILNWRPSVVAVELPMVLESLILQAVGRLPQLSVILYTKEHLEKTFYLPIELADPFVEAIRTAQEVGVEVAFIAPDFNEQPAELWDFPDTYAARRLGVQVYLESYRLFPPVHASGQSYANGVAWKLQGLNPSAPILVVVSLQTLNPIMESMEIPQSPPPVFNQLQDTEIYNLHPDCIAEVCLEAPLLQAVYEFRRYWIPEEEWIDGTSIPTTVENPSSQMEKSVRRIARHSNWRKEKDLDSLTSDSTQNPLARKLPGDSVGGEGFIPFLDRQRFNFLLFAEAERLYEKNTGEKIQHWQRRLFARYSRNLALISRMLVAGPFDLTIAARSIVDDNFAWELWNLASTALFQKIETDLSTVNISGEEVWVNMKRIQLHRRLPKPKSRPKPAGFRPRNKEDHPGEWARQFNGKQICSYPPEDIVLEDYGLFLKKKGKSILSQERSRVEPFTSSLLDGIDMRETLRHWHEKKLFVREFQKVGGDVGSVVVVFDEDRDGHYNWGMTWLGEHQQESDMAFYSTDPADKIVGPGICRAEYGGFLLSYPPRRMLDVWHDPDYWLAESKPETLLLAALDYSLQKFVVYVAAKPPRSVFKSLAAKMGKKIIYIPIGQLSPIAMKKIRVTHILDSYEKRAIAKNYIW
jgi:hypothetical protein